MLMKLKSGVVRSDMHIIRTKIAYFSAMCIAVMLSFTGYVQSQIANDMDLLTETDTTSRIVEIDKIIITGNKKTKDHIIMRELDIKPGERYNLQDLRVIINDDRNKVYNTSLFNTVEIHIYELTFNRVLIQVDVDERWYFYPIPKIAFVDRNFNDWVINHDADLNRLNYGVKLTQFNFRGRKERLHVLFQGGYTKAAGLQYDIPYIDKSQRTGLSYQIGYGENTNIRYSTIDNIQQFIDSDLIIKTSFNTQLSIIRRNSFYIRHHFGLEYDNQWIADTVITQNPEYFNNSNTRQQYFTIGYLFSFDHRDIIAYPLRGDLFRFSVMKRGLGIFDDLNMFNILTSYSKFWELNNKFFLSNYTSVYLSFPAQQPYANISGLGYNKNTIRGYELLVIDGKSYIINKTTFKKELFAFNKKINAIPIKQFQSFPLAIYLKTYFDFGYVSNLENPELTTSLTNTFIYGYGLGLDMFTTYDLVIRIEYSINSQNDTGFFLHFRKDF